MLTLEQFKATGRDVPDISQYSECAQPAAGRVYMDGTLSIEGHPGEWLLVIGNQQTMGTGDEPGWLESQLYDWAKDEYGEMFDTEYRIPPCPINPTEAQMQEWFEEMHKRGLSYHPDDDPAEVISTLTPIGCERLFHDNECEALRRIMRDLFRLHGDRVHQVANEVVGVTTGDEE